MPAERQRQEPPRAPAIEAEPAPAPADESEVDVQAAAEQVAAGEIAAEQVAAEDLEPLEPINGDEPTVEPAPEPRIDEVRSPTLERLGAEGLARLRARYAEVLARIAERPLDEAAKEQLKLQAERLNPDAWVTAAEVGEGLEQYEAVYESLRAVVGTGHRRRRRRR